MSNVAEMMLEGVLCQKCGVAIGDGVGFPRDCEDCRRDHNKERGIRGPELLGKQLRRRLELLADCARAASDAPKQYERLQRMGYCTIEPGDGRGIPTDMLTVWITEAGRAVLAASQDAKATTANRESQEAGQSETDSGAKP